MISPNAVIEQLTAALPKGVVITDPAQVADRITDVSGVTASQAPLVLVRVTNADQVPDVVRIAAKHGVPIVPQGSLSGLAGAGSAIDGAILLDMSRLNRILAIDDVEQVAVVEPGVIVADLQAAVARAGLFYPPDPASVKVASIGGTVATNAGGVRAVKYGVTRDWVRSLEVVLADGTQISTRPRTIKSVAGYDLTSLIIGSEGTLGIVTQATLSLLPAPGPERAVSAAFASVNEALDAADVIVNGAARPSSLELLDGEVLAALRAHGFTALPEKAQAWLFAATDEHGDAAETLASFTEAVQVAGAIEVSQANTAEETEALMAARRAFQPATRALRGGSYNGDVCVPRTHLRELFARIPEIARAHGVVIATGGHVGDGNLHPVVMFDPNSPEDVLAAEHAQADLLALATELEGTVTGEHGVGLEKRPALDAQLGPTVRELQRQIKQTFDPKGILNPGKKI